MLKDIIKNNGIKKDQIIRMIDYYAFEDYFKQNNENKKSFSEIELLCVRLEDLYNCPYKEQILDLDVNTAYWETKNLIVQLKLNKQEREMLQKCKKNVIQSQSNHRKEKEEIDE